MNKIIRKVGKILAFVFLFAMVFLPFHNYIESRIHANDELNTISSQINNTQKEKDSIVKKINDIEASIKQYNKASSDLKANLRALETKQSELNTEVENLNKQIIIQEENLLKFDELLKQKEIDTNNKINYLYKLTFIGQDPFAEEEDLQEYFNQRLQLTFEIDLYKQQIKDYSSQIDLAKSAKEQILLDKTTAQTAVDSLNSEITALRKQVTENDKKIADANKTKSSLSIKFNELNNQLKGLSQKQKELLEAELAKMNSATQSNQKPLEPGQYYFMGRGRDLIEGHGLGMSQWGAFGMAQKGWTYDRILTFYYTNTVIGDYNEPDTVILTDKRISGNGTLALTPGSNIVNATGALFTKDLVVGRSTNIVLAGVNHPRTITKINSDTQFEVNSPLPVSGPTNTTTYDRDTVSFQDYLAGIGEVPNSWPAEAVKAQVVAARTYAMGVCGGNKVCSICTTASCQVYNGGLGKKSFVDSTKGKVILYNGAPIVAYYSASHRGCSSSLNTVWGGTDKPYIQSVRDDDYAYKDYQSPNPYNTSQMIKTYNWTWRTNGYSLDQLTQITSKSSSLDVGTVTNVDTLKDACGRVARITLKGSKGTKTMTGWDFRSRFNAATPFNDYIYSTEFGFYKN